MENESVILGVSLSDWIQIAVLVVLILYTRATYRLVKPAIQQAAASEALNQAAVEQSRAAVEQARAAVEQIEAAQRPCLVPRQFPQYNPQIEEVVRGAQESGEMTLQVENVGNGPAINLRLYLALPSEGYPSATNPPHYQGPFALYPRVPLDTKIHVLDLGRGGPQRLLFFYESVTGRGYWTSADSFGPGPEGSLSLTNVQAGRPA